MFFREWEKNKIRIIAWAVLSVFSIIYFVGLYYLDIHATYHYSLLFLDCLKDGDLFHFYDISTKLQGLSAEGALYFIPIYMIFAIWNLPVWILSRFLGVNADAIGCLLWSKGIVVLFAGGSIWILYLILKKLEYRYLEYAIFLFFSSLLFFVPALAIAQYDIINVFFMLCGIWFYLKDERLSWRVLLLFSVAVSIKIFAVFVLLILVLVVEKRVWRIIADVICGLLFTGIIMLPWYAEYSKLAKSFNEGWLKVLFEKVLPGGTGGISVFTMGFLVIIIVAYMSKRKEIQQQLKLMLWLIAAFFLLLFTTVLAHPYWIIMLLPFILPLLVENRENLKINIILEMALECAIIVVQGVVFNWVYFCDKSFSYLVFRNTHYAIDEGAIGINSIFTHFRIEGLVAGIYAVFVVCGAALLIINNPWKAILTGSDEKEANCVETTSRFLRIGLAAFYLLCTYIIAYMI